MSVQLEEFTPPSRYIVGIDLGTTNCAVAFVDSESSSRRVEPFAIQQWVDWQTLEARATLPSFHLQWTDREKEELKLGPKSPFVNVDYVVGCFARDRGADLPDRQVGSAKSWLCHPDVDRTSPILPWHAAVDIERISPVEASSRYLKHLRLAWDAAHPKYPLADCDVVVTLPASFDEVARELTIEAARTAGLPKIVLIEEPQAAFYAWLQRHESSWRDRIKPGQTVLICDIGGGTTDFTLIRVRESDSTDEYGLHRVAVGRHLMLGGDNLDLALSKAVEPLFAPADGQRFSLNNTQWESLRMQCRNAKESILSHTAPTEFKLTVAGTGSKLIGTTRSVTIDRPFVEKVLIDGFFPFVSLSERPHSGDVGLFEFGLPFEADPAVTRHLAEFLWEHRWAGRTEESRSILSDQQAAKPDWVLFNGGVLESEAVRERLLEQLDRWFHEGEATQRATAMLDAERLDLAVAIGAAYFGRTRRGDGVRIDARLARAYYLQLSIDPPLAICVMPADAETLDRFVLSEHPFELETNRPVQFPILVSSTHLVDRIGDIVPIDLQRMSPLPSIQTVIETSRSKRHEKCRIVVESELTEIGTLDLSLVAARDGNSATMHTDARWKLAFDLRSTVETDRSAHTGLAEQAGIVDNEAIERATQVIIEAFDDNASPDLAKNLVKRLSTVLETPRELWKPSLLRAIWQTLIDVEPARKRSQVVEARWINLLGYSLRPGYGFAADDWRVQLSRRKLHGKIQFSANASETLILWRRISGGFTTGQQQAVWQELQGRVRRMLEVGQKGDGFLQENIETLRLVGSLELLSIRTKIDLGKQAIQALTRPKLTPLHESIFWLLGRLGARILVYGPMSSVVPIEVAEQWISTLCNSTDGTSARQFGVMQLARKTGDRFRDVSESSRNEVEQAFERWSAPSSYRELIRQVARLDGEQQTKLIGEALPLGIQLR